MAPHPPTKLDRLRARADWPQRLTATVQYAIAVELNRKKRLGEPIVIWDGEKLEPKTLQADEYEFVDLTPDEKLLADERAADTARDEQQGGQGVRPTFPPRTPPAACVAPAVPFFASQPRVWSLETRSRPSGHTLRTGGWRAGAWRANQSAAPGYGTGFQ